MGPAESVSVESLMLAEAPVGNLANDLVPPPPPYVPEPDVRGSGVESADVAEPKVLFLWYADGGPQPAPVGYQNALCTGNPPKYVCTWAAGGGDACRTRIQAYLDAAYQDFNLVFSYARPTAGTFYTVIVTNTASWCSGVPANAGGITWNSKCIDLKGGVAYALLCGNYTSDPAQFCANVIAHEHGHMVGLMHTCGDSACTVPTIDIMNASTCTQCKLFDKTPHPIDTPQCLRPSQSSYDMMISALGAWPGGAKPPPIPACTDTAPPSVTISAPANGATVGQSFDVTASASDDCSGVVSGRITIGALTASADGPGPWTWPVSGLTGNLVIKVEATDAKGNVGSASVTVAGPGSPGLESPDGSESETDGEVVVEPPPSSRDCGCALGARAARPGATAALLVTGALALVRRRRRVSLTPRG